MNYDRLKTVKQLAEENPAFTEASLRWLIYRAEENGIDEVLAGGAAGVVRHGPLRGVAGEAAAGEAQLPGRKRRFILATTPLVCRSVRWA